MYRSTLPQLSGLIEGRSLQRKEAKCLFEKIFQYDKKGYFFTAAMSAIHAKGETPEELAGVVDALKSLSPKPTKTNLGLTTDTSGTGASDSKTINVSTLVAFILATLEIKVAKASFYGVTSKLGSADVLSELGIKIEKINSLDKLLKVLKKTNIVFYYTPYLTPKLKNRSRLFKKVFIEEGLKVKSPFHLTTNVFSPLPIKKRIYGVYDQRYLSSIAKMYHLLGHEQTLVYSSKLKCPELLNTSINYAYLQTKATFKKLTLTAKDFGLKLVKPEDIAFQNKNHSIKVFLEILKGKNRGPYAQLVWMNAAAALWILNKVKNFKKGVEITKRLLFSGKAYETYLKVRKAYLEG